MKEIEYYIDTLVNNKMLKIKEIEYICHFVKDIFINEPNILNLGSNIYVIGSLHGSFNDLIDILKIGGHLSKNKFLFLGNYINRGKCSIETFLLLILLKIKFQYNIYLIRGKNETRSLSEIYGLKEESKIKYGDTSVWRIFVELFEYLPLSAVIDDKIFCISGGIGKEIKNINIIKSFYRLTDLEDDTLLNEILFSEPNTKILKNEKNPIGTGYLFSENNLNNFLNENNFKLFIKSGKYTENGIEYYFNKKLISIFSNSNTITNINNNGCFIEIKNGKIFDIIYINNTKINNNFI